MARRGNRDRAALGGLLVAAIIAAGCGARLNSTDLANARARGAGGQVTAGGSTDTGAATGGGAAGGSSPTGSGGGAAGGTANSGASGSATGNSATPGGTTAAGGKTAANSPGQATPGAAAQAPGGANPFGGAPPGGNGGATDVGVTATEIDLGNVSTVGGPVPGLFAGAYDGALAYARYVNSQGGIYGRQLVIKFKDDQLNAAQNKAATDALLSQVLGFVGSFSLESSAGSPDIESAGAPNVSYAIDQQTQHEKTNFSPTPLGSGWPVGPLTYFKTKFGPAVTSKMAVYVEDNPTAISAAAQEQAALNHLGYVTVYSRKIEATETNFQGDVKSMQDKGVKGLILQGEVSTMARMASAMHDASFTIPFADWGAPAYDPGFISLANGGAEGAVLNQQLAMYAGEDAAKIPEVGVFDTWMKRVDPSQNIDFFAAQSWAAGALMTQALIKAGPHVTRKAVLAALSTIHSFNDNGMLAPDDPAGKVSPTCWIAIDVKGGKFVRDPANPAGFRCNDGGYYQP